ncbi:hypothetical protein TCAL_17071 [Tigriopus californicus]|uniref:Uncharacterized protein n=1 Tax=Tigriopus californicus TaxID=6832 RepID=A0A553PQ95_TIGCA|nr:hypothetical protein TCAL_17071 [Tigriopus californicus]
MSTTSLVFKCARMASMNSSATLCMFTNMFLSFPEVQMNIRIEQEEQVPSEDLKLGLRRVFQYECPQNLEQGDFDLGHGEFDTRAISWTGPKAENGYYGQDGAGQKHPIWKGGLHRTRLIVDQSQDKKDDSDCQK